MQEYKDWDGNLLPDPAPHIRNIHIGDIIKTEHKSIEEPRERATPIYQRDQGIRGNNCLSAYGPDQRLQDRLYKVFLLR